MVIPRNSQSIQEEGCTAHNVFRRWCRQTYKTIRRRGSGGMNADRRGCNLTFKAVWVNIAVTKLDIVLYFLLSIRKRIITRKSPNIFSKNRGDTVCYSTFRKLYGHGSVVTGFRSVWKNEAGNEAAMSVCHIQPNRKTSSKFSENFGFLFKKENEKL